MVDVDQRLYLQFLSQYVRYFFLRLLAQTALMLKQPFLFKQPKRLSSRGRPAVMTLFFCYMATNLADTNLLRVDHHASVHSTKLPRPQTANTWAFRPWNYRISYRVLRGLYRFVGFKLVCSQLNRRNDMWSFTTRRTLLKQAGMFIFKQGWI